MSLCEEMVFISRSNHRRYGDRFAQALDLELGAGIDSEVAEIASNIHSPMSLGMLPLALTPHFPSGVA